MNENRQDEKLAPAPRGLLIFLYLLMRKSSTKPLKTGVSTYGN